MALGGFALFGFLLPMLLFLLLVFFFDLFGFKGLLVAS